MSPLPPPRPPQATAHELGHNLFLSHATTNTSGVVDDYGDATCVMGACCGGRCPNTPHAWQLGWVSAAQYDGTSLAPGATVTATVWAHAEAAGVATRAGGLRVLPTWAPDQPPLFVGYRTRVGGDAALDPSLTSKVHVYTSASTGTHDPAPTEWKGGLARGDAWTHPTAGLVVRVTGMTATTATVTLCRKAGAETLASCQAGRDHDCNGLVGAKDAACAKLLAAAGVAANATAAARPPPPPPPLRRSPPPAARPPPAAANLVRQPPPPPRKRPSPPAARRPPPVAPAAKRPPPPAQAGARAARRPPPPPKAAG